MSMVERRVFVGDHRERKRRMRRRYFSSAMFPARASAVVDAYVFMLPVILETRPQASILDVLESEGIIRKLQAVA